MAKNIKSVLTDLFDPNLSQRFSRNGNKKDVGHTAATALANYVVPKGRREILSTYLNELSKLQND